MAGTRSVHQGQDEGHIDDWMGNRIAYLERVANGAHEAGQRLWSESTRTGGNVSAARPSDVVALGVARTPKAPPPPALSPEMQELRRQQAAFKDVTRQLDHDNRWMAGVALAPIAAVGGLEALTFDAARQVLNPPGEPLQLQGREPLRTRGETYYTRYGKRQHDAFREKVDAKPGWRSDPRVQTEGGLKIPDAQTPIRSSGARNYVDLKPDTPSGRRRGQQTIKNYADAGKTRIIYYPPPPK